MNAKQAPKEIHPLRSSEPRAQSVRRMFSSIAPRYDFLNHFLSMSLDYRWRKAAVRKMRDVLDRPRNRVLDLCCGTADLALALAQESRGAVVGADFCHPMLVRGQQKIVNGKNAPPVFLSEADALALPFAEGAFDGIAIAFGLRNLEDVEQGLREMYRVLQPGGRLCVLEFSRPSAPLFRKAFQFYFDFILPRLGDTISGVSGPYAYLRDSVTQFLDQEDLVQTMRAAGFRDVEYVNLTGGVAALHFGKK